MPTTDRPGVQGSPHPLRHKFSGPGIPRGVLSRPRLDRQLNELFDAYSVVEIVSAPGSGKTVQAQLYAAQAGHALAWLTLDRRDQSATGLVFDLATALEGVVEDAVATTRRALLGEEKPEEAAAILASAAGSAECLLVIDECQQISSAADAAATLDTFLEYIPETMHVLLLARDELPWPLQRRYVHGQIAQLGQSTMDLTLDETVEYVCRLTGSPEHSERIFAQTGGWAAGVALACRFAGEQEPDLRDLSTYLRRQVLDPLPADEQEFLLDTSVADVVTTEVAVALCGDSGARLFNAVLARHLPATSTTGGTIHYHSLFRTFLQTRLVETGRHRDRSQVYAAHLASLRQYEDATEVLFSIGDHDGAYRTAVQALPALYAHANWPVVTRWLTLLGEDRLRDDPLWIGAQIRAIHGTREFDDARALVRRLDREGRLRAALTSDPSLVATAAWALQSYPREVLTLLDKYEGDQCAEVVRYMIETIVGTRPATQPLVDDVGEVERLLTWALFVQGRLGDLAAREIVDSDRPVLNPNVVLAPALREQADVARALWLRVPAEIRSRPHSRFIEALLDLGSGDRAKAMEHLQLALTDSQRSGFSLGPVYQIFIGYVLVLSESAGAAEAAIDHLIPLLDAMSQSGQTAYVEWSQCFLGLAYLKAGRDSEALYILREVVASMTRSQRRLLLSLAAAALAEAEARAGDEQAAHEAAQLAYHVAQLTSSFALLVQAVRLFPEVQRREIAHNPQDSRWRRLVVSPSARPRHEPSSTAPARAVARPEPAVATDGLVLRILPFGHDRDLFLDGVPARIGRIKILELVALMALHPSGIERFQLQQRLFPESDQRSGGNHFRQIAHKLRRSTGVALARQDSVIAMPDTVTLRADDIECEQLLAAVSGVTGAERLELLREALGVATGSYLEGSTLIWAEERRHHLDVVREEARLELAALYLEAGQPDQARAECEAVLAANRYSDPAYRLSVEIERRVGSESAAIAAYRRAAEALAELGLRPGDARRMLRRPNPPGGEQSATG